MCTVAEANFLTSDVVVARRNEIESFPDYCVRENLVMLEEYSRESIDSHHHGVILVIDYVRSTQ